MSDVLFARCNYAKIPSRRLLLTIEREHGRRWVYKQACNAEGVEYLKSILEQERLVAAYVAGRADVVVGQLTGDGRARYPFIEMPTLQYVIAEHLENQRTSAAWDIVNDAVLWMKGLDSVEADPSHNASLTALYGSPLPFGETTACLRVGLLDLIGQNILYDEARRRYWLIDHELVTPGPVPLELTIFRFLLFTISPLKGILELHAPLQPIRTVGRGELRVPAAWDFGAWLDEQRLEVLIALEERLQSHFTGQMETWPRDPRPALTHRHPPNAYQLISSLAVRLQGSSATTTTEA